MEFVNATSLNRKSGVAKGRDLQFALMEKQNLKGLRPRHSTCPKVKLNETRRVPCIPLKAKEFPDRRSLFTNAAVYLSREFRAVVRCINPWVPCKLMEN